MNRKAFALIAGFVSVLGLSACSDLFSDEPPPLKGERISVLELQKSLEPDDMALEAQGLVMPKAWRNEFWPQVGGYPNHSMQNLVMSEGELERVWRADIGRGGSSEIPLLSQPILVDGLIYTLDARANLSAFDIEDGDRLWRVDVSDEEEGDTVIAGGIAFSKNTLFVTNGYSQLVAVDPQSGEIKWRAKLPAPSKAAPSVMGGRIYVTTLDSRVLALDIDNGEVLWAYEGNAEDTGLVGTASPAVNNDIVVPVFSSGEIIALRVENGSVAWGDNLAAVRGFGGLSAIADIRAMPVLDKGLVFAVSFSGRMVAIDERTGQRVWQREISATQTPWVAGNHVFVLSAENQLISLGRDTGAVRWVTELPRYEDDEPVVLTGPVLAGGRLIVVGSEGRVFEIEPEGGEIIREWDAGNTISISPIVAGGTLYLLENNGTLSAYR